MGRRGPRPLPVAELKRRGTYKRCEHAHRETNGMIKSETEIAVPEAPSHLSDAMRRFWGVVNACLELEPHQVHTLQLGCEAFDDAQRARKILEAEGMTFTDRFGQPRPRPECTIEHNARLAFAKLMREVGLDDSQRCLRDAAPDVLAQMIAARDTNPIAAKPNAIRNGK